MGSEDYLSTEKLLQQLSSASVMECLGNGSFKEDEFGSLVAGKPDVDNLAST